MNTVLPARFLFRYSFPVKKFAKLPKRGKTLLGLGPECALRNLGDLDQGNHFAEIRLAWNEKGLGVAAHIRGKKHPAVGDEKKPTESDGVQIWIDTRDTKTIHRASRFCHHFCLLPSASGPGKDRPAVVQLPIARAREQAAIADSKNFKIVAAQLKTGYSLEAWFSREQLTGFDPEASPRLGFYFHVRDSELGEQFLSIGEEFPFASDPSMWGTLELVG